MRSKPASQPATEIRYRKKKKKDDFCYLQLAQNKTSVPTPTCRRCPAYRSLVDLVVFSSYNVVLCGVADLYGADTRRSKKA
jgi:hypothetical protein